MIQLDFFTGLLQKALTPNSKVFYHVLQALWLVSCCYDELNADDRKDGVVTLAALQDFAQPKLVNDSFKDAPGSAEVITAVFNLFEAVKLLFKKA